MSSVQAKFDECESQYGQLESEIRELNTNLADLNAQKDAINKQIRELKVKTGFFEIIDNIDGVSNKLKDLDTQMKPVRELYCHKQSAAELQRLVDEYNGKLIAAYPFIRKVYRDHGSEPPAHMITSSDTPKCGSFNEKIHEEILAKVHARKIEIFPNFFEYHKKVEQLVRSLQYIKHLHDQLLPNAKRKGHGDDFLLRVSDMLEPYYRYIPSEFTWKVMTITIKRYTYKDHHYHSY